MRRETSIRTAGLAVMALAGMFVFGLSAIAHATSSYSVRPGESNPADPATRAYFKPVLRPGSSITQSVIVANTGPSTLALLVYPVDGLTGQTTGTVYADQHDPVRKAGLWVTPGVSRISVAPGAQVSVPFTVQVPGGAKPGDHVAGIAFQAANQKVSSGAFRITEIFREVIGIWIRVPGRAFPRLTLGATQLKPLPGTPFASFVVGLGNSGLAMCKPRLAVSMRGPNGYQHTVVRPLDTVLPGETVAYPLPWPGRLQAGGYSALTSASCHGKVVSHVTALQLGKPLGVALPRRQAASSGSDAIPSWLLIVVALASLAIGVTLTQMRMARRHRAALVAARASVNAGMPTAVSSAEHPAST